MVLLNADEKILMANIMGKEQMGLTQKCQDSVSSTKVNITHVLDGSSVSGRETVTHHDGLSANGREKENAAETKLEKEAPAGRPKTQGPRRGPLLLLGGLATTLTRLRRTSLSLLLGHARLAGTSTAALGPLLVNELVLVVRLGLALGILLRGLGCGFLSGSSFGATAALLGSLLSGLLLIATLGLVFSAILRGFGRGLLSSSSLSAAAALLGRMALGLWLFLLSGGVLVGSFGLLRGSGLAFNLGVLIILGLLGMS